MQLVRDVCARGEGERKHRGGAVRGGGGEEVGGRRLRPQARLLEAVAAACVTRGAVTLYGWFFVTS